MELWTIQLSQWRVAQRLAIPLIDTTVKSGDPVFAPTWEIVTAVKSGRITQQQYTEHYLSLMRKSWLNNRQRWLDLCHQDTAAIACYCAQGVFCHRHLLAEYLKRVCVSQDIPFVLKGELTQASVNRSNDDE